MKGRYRGKEAKGSGRWKTTGRSRLGRRQSRKRTRTRRRKTGSNGGGKCCCVNSAFICFCGWFARKRDTETQRQTDCEVD